MTLHSSQDPASTSLAAGAAAGSFLPNISRTHFAPAGAPSHPVGYVTAGARPSNALAQAATTHHHLNVTLGEEKFYLTAKEDNLQQITYRRSSKGNLLMDCVLGEGAERSRMPTRLGRPAARCGFLERFGGKGGWLNSS